MTAPADLPAAPARSDTESEFKANANAFFQGLYDYIDEVEAYTLERTTAFNAAAQAMGYSGFSASNYFYQPYNSALDFGTADFFVGFWINPTDDSGATNKIVFERSYNPSAGVRSGSLLQSFVTTTGVLSFLISDDGYSTYDAFASPPSVSYGEYGFYFIQRVSNTLFLYKNGAYLTSQAITNAAGSLSNASAELRVGLDIPAAGGGPIKISGFRIGTGSLTADEILAMYKREHGKFKAPTTYESFPAFVVPAGCKVMALCDDTVETVTGTENVTNGDGSSTTGWTGTATKSLVGGKLRLTNPSAVNSYVQQIVTLVSGKRYALRGTWTAGTATSNPNGFEVNNGTSATIATPTTGVVTVVYFTAGTTNTITMYVGSAISAEYSDWDDVSVKECDDDISGNGKDLIVIGSLTKAVAYTGGGALPITALPAVPSSVSDAAAYVASCTAFLAALPTLRTELNTYVGRTVITALPTAPARTTSDSAYIATIDAYLAALPTFRTEINAYAGKPGVWSAGGALNTARSSLAGAGTLTAGLAFGGYTGAVSAVTEEYNGTAWSSGGALATARQYLAGAGTQSAAIGFGGDTGAVSAVTEEYDGAAWSSGGALATARRGLAGAGTLTAGLAFGGASTATNTEEYDGAAWSSGGALVTGRGFLSGAGTQSAGLSFGGHNGATYYGNTEGYDGTTWTVGSNLGTGRAYMGGTGSAMAALAAVGEYGSRSSITEEYDGSTWALGGDATTNRGEVAASGSQNAGLLFGGSDGSLTTLTQEYTRII